MNDKVLIAENKRTTETASGIILEQGTGETKTGTVLAIGPNVTEVKVGDKILLNWEKGVVVKIENDYRIILKEEFITAVLE